MPKSKVQKELQEQESKKLTAVIKDIKIDKEKRIAILGVAITCEGDTWNKAFRIDYKQKVKLDDFREILLQHIKEDLDKEMNLREILDIQGKNLSFELK